MSTQDKSKTKPKKKMTLAEFMQNPSGIGSSAFYRRDLIVQNLKSRYQDLINKVKTRNEISHRIFEIDEKNILFLIKIPSEKYDIVYDVVFLFTLVDEKMAGNLLTAYDISFFSNNPAFTFNYAYVLKKKDMLIKFLFPKINKKALTLPPSVRNPSMILGFEKSLYFAGLYMINNKLYRKDTIDSNKETFDLKKFLNIVSSDDEILVKYIKLKKKITADAEKLRKEKKREKLLVDNKRSNVEKRERIKKIREEGAAKLNRKVDRRKKKISKIRAKKTLRSTIKYSKKKK